jgi:hypothetical protein
LALLLNVKSRSRVVPVSQALKASSRALPVGRFSSKREKQALVCVGPGKVLGLSALHISWLLRLLTRGRIALLTLL